MAQPRFAVCGAGFWSQFQLAAWQELGMAQCVAICDPQPAKAAGLAQRFGIAECFTSPRDMLENTSLDFIDVISSPSSHEEVVCLAAQHRVPVICQKPMAEELAACERMVAACAATQTWFAIHENWRWQTTLRRVRDLVATHRIGSVFRARIDFITGFDVFANQPTLKDAPHFIIADLGVHVIDYARSLFGEAQSLYCRTRSTQSDVRGEDVASLALWMNQGQTMVDINVAYARNFLRHDCFPQTTLFIEGTEGSLELTCDYHLYITDRHGTTEELLSPPQYDWVDPRYAIVHSSMVACNRHMLTALQSQEPAETHGEDNLRTMRLVFAAYESAAQQSVIRCD